METAGKGFLHTAELSLAFTGHMTAAAEADFEFLVFYQIFQSFERHGRFNSPLIFAGVSFGFKGDVCYVSDLAGSGVELHPVNTL